LTSLQQISNTIFQILTSHPQETTGDFQELPLTRVSLFQALVSTPITSKEQEHVREEKKKKNGSFVFREKLA